MPSNHLVLCRPLLLLPSIFLSIRVFSNESALHVRWPKYWSFSFSINPSNEYSELISFRMDWLDLLALQGALKSLLQHHSSKASILQPSAFFTVQFSHPYMTTGKTIALTRWTFVGKVMSLLFNMLSRLVIAFLPGSQPLLIHGSDFGAQEKKVCDYRVCGRVDGEVQEVYAEGAFQCPRPCGEPLPTHTSTGAPPTLAGSFGSVSCVVTAPLLWVLVWTKFCLCPPWLESLSPPVLWKTYNQIPLALKARFPGDSQSLCWVPQAGNPDLGFRTFTTVWELLWVLLFSSLWVTHPAGMGFDFIVIASLLPSRCIFFVVSGRGVPFFWWVPVASCPWLFNS